jgi:hypothetical protein
MNTSPARRATWWKARLTAWLSNHVATLLKPLIDLGADQALAGMARGIAFRLVENLGILERRSVLEDVRGLTQDERAGLRRHGVRFGAYQSTFPSSEASASTLLAQLWALNTRISISRGWPSCRRSPALVERRSPSTRPFPRTSTGGSGSVSTATGGAYRYPRASR